jgi:hypothetical protein
VNSGVRDGNYPRAFLKSEDGTMPKAVTKKAAEAFAPLTVPAELQALVQAIDAPDRDTTKQLPIVLLQHNSVEKLEANADAEPGGYLIPHGDDTLVIAKAKGFAFVPFGFEFVYYLWELTPGGPPLGILPRRPPGTHWLKKADAPGNKEGAYLEMDGELVRVDATLLEHVLICEPDIEPFAACLAYKSTSLKVGEAHERVAGKVKALVGDMRGNVCGLWRATTELVRDGSNAWFVPVLTAIGAFGAPNGPTVAQVKQAVELRQQFRQTLPNALTPQSDPPAAIAPPRGSITVTSGRPTPSAIDPNLNDPIPY